jgi:voltage-gated sodium channel
VVNALTAAIPGMASIAVVLVVLFYVSAVLSTKLFGSDFDAWFGSLGRSFFTLFQIMTLEGWSDGLVRPIMAVHPWSWLFFIPFIVITSFAVLNLFIGVIVSAIQEVAEPSKAETGMEAEIKALRKDMDELLRRLPAPREDHREG